MGIKPLLQRDEIECISARPTAHLMIGGELHLQSDH
jgi:hypothetical protein